MKGTEDGIRTKTKGLEMFVKNQSRENKSAVEDRKRQCKGLRLLKQHFSIPFGCHYTFAERRMQK